MENIIDNGLSKIVLYENLHDCIIDSYKPILWQPSDQNVRGFIESEWERIYQINKKNKCFLVNGPKVRANNMSVLGGVLHLDLQLTDYKTHVTTRDNPTIPENQRGSTLYVSINLISSDNYFVFGRTETSEVQFKGMVNLIAGAVEPENVHIGKGLEETVFCELLEETGQKQESVSRYCPSFVIREKIAAHPSVVYITHSYLSKRDMENVFLSHLDKLKKKSESPELNSLHFVPKSIKSLDNVFEDNSYKIHERVLSVLKYAIVNKKDYL